MSIPEELKSYPQWIVWREARRADGKLDKIPINPITGYPASVTRKEHWTTYEHALNQYQTHGYGGLGFVLSDDDPYVFIDLDYTENVEDQALQMQIFENVISYAEMSPTGTGLHIIARGDLPQGRKTRSVEMYSASRFMTMTGNTFRDLPIHDCSDVINSLYEYLQPQCLLADSLVDEPDTGNDDEVLVWASNASNGEKFKDLWSGDWHKHYEGKSQSEADQALVNILAFYSNSRVQVKRLFLASALGQRDKARRHKTYVENMVIKSFDRKLPIPDLTAIHAAISDEVARRNVEEMAEKAHADPLPTQVSKPKTRDTRIEDDSLYPPGLIGEFARFIYKAAPRPIEEVAIVGAMAMFAGMCGRCYNVSGTGLNQYFILVGTTGVGKEAIGIGMNVVRTHLAKKLPDALKFFGPSEIASPQAIRAYLSDGNHSFVSYSGEIGKHLKQMLSPKAPPNIEGVIRFFLDVYNKSGEGDVLGKSVYANREKNLHDVLSPAITWLGETTPESLWPYITEASIADGFLPRISILETPSVRPRYRKDHKANRAAIPDELISRIAALAAQAIFLNRENTVQNVRFSPEAESLSDAFNNFCDDQFETEGVTSVDKQLWNRAHMKTMKIAALIAVGENYMDPVISAETWLWAQRLTERDVRGVLSRFHAGEIAADNCENQQITTVISRVRSWLFNSWESLQGYTDKNEVTHNLYSKKLVPYSYIHRSTIQLSCFRNDRNGATFALKRVLKTLTDRGDLTEIPIHQRAKDLGTNQIVYSITNANLFTGRQ